MSPGRHIAFDSLSLCNVDHGIEKVSFAMLAAEILQKKVYISKVIESLERKSVEEGEDGSGGRYGRVVLRDL